jgi:ABC-2 type transport system permease protein
VTILLFAWMTVLELVRRRLAAAVAILTLLIVAFTAWGLHRIASGGSGSEPLGETQLRATTAAIVMLLAFLFSFVIALGAALAGAPALASEVANGEILAVLARPVRRADVMLGRWLGVLAALTCYVATAGATELFIVKLMTGYAPPDPPAALAYLAGVAAVVTTAAVALAARLPAIAAGIVAALLFGLAWIGGILEAIGLRLGNAPLADGGTIVTLLFPSDALWRGAVYALQPAAFTAAASASGSPPVNPFTVVSPPPVALLAWACGWVAVVLATGVALYRRRDL